jgi:hypothetical protein
MPAHIQATATASGCENNPGPFITLTGEISLGGLTAELIFRNNEKGTHEHTEETTVSVVVVPEGETIQFAKQPPLGGAGGNPWIFLQLVDSNGNVITDEILLGRCVQGLSEISADFFVPATANAEVSVEDCSNSPGPFVTVSGELSLTGINALLIFRNNMQGTHEHVEETVVEIVIIPAGETITIPKQPVLGGVGGNPLISVQFLDGDGQPIGDEFLLGRCVQLSKA